MRIRELLSRIAIDPVDLVALASTAVLGTGVAMVSVPAAFVVVGGLGLMYAVAASRNQPGGET